MGCCDCLSQQSNSLIKTMKRNIILYSIIAATLSGHAAEPARVKAGDLMSHVYRQLGEPTIEYPHNGRFVHKYKDCVISSTNGVVLAADYGDEPKEPELSPEAQRMKKLRTSAEKGKADAQYLLAFAYQNGDFVNKNMTEAVRWYTAAALQGHMASQHNLGVIHMQGIGVAKNYEKAYAWALLAKENGNDTLARTLETILQPEQKSAAVKMLAKMQAAAKNTSE
jgi:hypothetical protein